MCSRLREKKKGRWGKENGICIVLLLYIQSSYMYKVVFFLGGGPFLYCFKNRGPHFIFPYI